MLPELRTDAETSEKLAAKDAIREPITAQPTANHALGAAKFSAEPLLRKTRASHRNPKKARALGKARAELSAVDECAHNAAQACLLLATLSMAKEETGASVSDDNAEVPTGDTRGDRYEAWAKLAGQRLTTRKAELEQEMGRDITTRELQDQTGVDKSQVSRILNGAQKNVSVGNFFAVCAALRIDPLKAWWGDSRRAPVGWPSLPVPPPIAQEIRRSEPPPASMSRPSTAPEKMRPPPAKKRKKRGA